MIVSFSSGSLGILVARILLLLCLVCSGVHDLAICSLLAPTHYGLAAVVIPNITIKSELLPFCHSQVALIIE